MKKMLIIALTTIAACTASASVARMAALNQSTEYGSKYILDSRNVFANPAHYHSLSSFVQLEFGDGGAINNTATTTSGVKAQGGFFQKSGNGGYGVWLGNDSTTAAAMRTLTGDASLPNPDNSTEFAYAGKSSVEWGASFLMTQNKDSDNTTTKNRSENSMAVRAGAKKGKWDAGVTLALSNKMEAEPTAGSKNTFTGKLGISLHGAYKLKNDFTGIFEYQTATGDYEVNNGTATAGIKLNSTKVGIAKKIAVDSGFFFWEAAYSQVVADNDKVGKATATTLPLTLGLEAKAAEWLTLRGSAKQNFFLNSTEVAPVSGTSTKSFLPDNISVAGGATMHFEKFNIDGVVVGTSGALNSTALLTNVSMNYSF